MHFKLTATNKNKKTSTNRIYMQDVYHKGKWEIGKLAALRFAKKLKHFVQKKCKFYDNAIKKLIDRSNVGLVSLKDSTRIS